ncbi:MAG TPA: amino acid adenylation domain-containing protein [Longimicrobium sp.]|nr:amino acid adenylation domain-containing protein [Longimicrobium sp.]
MTLADRLSALSDEKRRLVEMRLRLAREGAGAAPPLAAREHPDGTAPLSFAQARVWLLDRLEPGTPVWNIPFSLRLRGRLDVPALEQAFDALRRRHASLRTTVEERAGQPVQVIHPWAPVPLAVDDLADLDPAARLAEAERRAHDDASTGFDLAAGPLLRVRLLRLSGDDHVLLLVLHHIVGDGWSLGVIGRELAALYAAFLRGQPDPLPPPALQYADFAAWQREWFSGARLQREVEFWRAALAGAPAALELPADRPRPRVQGNQGARTGIALSPDTVVRLRELARAEHATLFAVVLAAVRAVLARWSASDDVVLGTPTAGRSRVETEGLVGFFVNTLALRTSTAGDPPFRELVRRERGTQLDAFGHQDLPFERVVEELRVARDPARHPVFQAMVALQNAGGAGGFELEGVHAEPVDAGWAASKFDLSFEAHEVGEALTLACDYDTALFAPHTAAALVSHVGWVLERASRDPDAPLSTLTVAGEDDAERLAAWAAAAPPPALGETIPARFAAVARRMGAATALAWRGGQMSYAEVDARTAALAVELRALGVGAETVVGVFLDWSPELPLALLAAMRAGGAYLPLDPSQPPERIALLLEDSGAGVVITTEALREKLPGTGIPVALVDSDRSDAESTNLSRNGGGGRPEAAGGGAMPAEAGPLPVERAESDLPEIHPASAAYLIYTSGSTGAPKGVLVPHGAALAHFAAAAELYGITPDDRVLGFAAQGFDPSLEQLVTPLLRGASLALRDAEMWAPADFPGRIRELGVTVANPPTPYWHQLMRDADAAAAARGALRLMIVGGDAIHPHAARAWDALPGGAALLNVYGPTETVVTSTAYRFPAGYAQTDEARVSVGAPTAGREPRVLDAALRPVPVGAPGELYLGGPVQSRGYHRRPALTAAAFLPDPFSPRPGARMYRTGDRARWRPDGTLEFLGRADQQVKVRGARVEPAEVEAALRALSAVAEGAVVARPDPAGAMHLVAFVVPRGAFDAAAIRAELARRLPAYLVPSLVVAADSLPRTPNGKIDRRALPSPDFGGVAAGRHVAPSTPDEEMLAALWADVLGADAVGAGDDFFERGGHSLLATQLVSRVRQAFGVEMPLRAVFEAPVLRDQAARVAALRAAGEGAPAGGIPRAERSRPLPLSFAQERLWFIDRLEPGSPAYNVPLALDLSGPLDADALARALGEIIRRHEALRTVFAVRDDQPVQSILSSNLVPLPVVDLAAHPGDEREIEAERIIATEARKPFDLAAGPLLRAILLRHGSGEHTLVLVLHHVATDAWSAGIFFRELAALYQAFAAGDDSPLPELPVQYADFAAWQRGWLRGDALERQMGYWRRKLAGIPAVLEFPTDRPRPAVQDLAGALLPFHLAAPTVDAARTLARREGATLFMVLLAAFDAVVHRWSGAEDIVVGTPIANRTRPELEGLIGFFDNTLALRTDLSGDPTFAALLRLVRETTLEAYAHQDVPFEKLVDELKAERSLSHAPLFQVMFTLQNTPTGGGAELGGLEIRGRAADTGTSRFDLTLILSETGDGALQGVAEYATALFEASTIERITTHLDALLRQAAARPDAPLSSLSLLSHEDEDAVLRRFNRTETSYPRGLGVHQLFEAQVDRTPNATAIVHDGARWSYAELERRANRLAHRLRALGVGPEAKVAVCMERTPELVAALFGVLKAGGAYLPIDPAYPAERIAFMVEESGAAVVLTHASLAERLPPTAARVLAVDADDGAAEPDTRPGLPVDERNLAYVIYTSGSTGRPKGVQIEHRASVAFLHWIRELVSDDERGAVLASTSVSFDVSVAEIFGTLSWGGSIVLVRNALSLKELEVPVTLASMAPSAAAELLRAGGIPPTLRRLNLAGEALPPALARGLHALGTLETVANCYGPTEDTTYSSAWEVPPGAERVLIGRPAANTRLYVLDGRLRPVPPGVPGELWIGGQGLSRGYHRRPALTADRFRPDPFGGEPGARIYRTGDRARWLAGGEMEYLGRVDFQVKIRGHRIEPGEVEAALAASPLLRQALVAARGEGAEARLVAWVVPAGGDEPSPAELRAWLRARVPDYMIPAAFVTLPELPVSPNGKVDRARLPDPAPDRPAGSVPESEMERLVAKVWEDALGAPGVCLDDGFFEIGGHSLLLPRVQERLRAALGRPVPMIDLFQFSTVRALAAHLEQPPAAADPSPRAEG